MVCVSDGIGYLLDMLGTLSPYQKRDWKSYLEPLHIIARAINLHAMRHSYAWKRATSTY